MKWPHSYFDCGTLLYFTLDVFAVRSPDLSKTDYFWKRLREEIAVRNKRMPREFFDPTPEEQVVVLVEHEIVRKAEGFIKSCEVAISTALSGRSTLFSIASLHPSVTDYVLEHPADCPNCHRNVLEETFIELS